MQSYLALHMLQKSHLVQRPSAPGDIHIRAQTIPIRRVNRPLLVNLVGLADMLGWHVGPLFGQVDHSARIHQTVAEFVGDLPLHTIQNPTGLVAQRFGPRGEYHQVLHVSPRKRGVRLESEGGDAGS